MNDSMALKFDTVKGLWLG